MAEIIDRTPDVWDATAMPAPAPPPAQKPRSLKPWIALAALALITVALATFFSSRPKSPPVFGASARSLAISTDGKLLLVGTLDGSLRLLSAESEKLLAKTALPHPILTLSFGPGNTVLVLAQNDATLHIFSPDLRQHWEREVPPNPHDLAWSASLDAAIVLSGGPDDIHARLQIFPAHPMGIANSTSQLLELKTWSTPRHLAVTADGHRAAISFATAARWANVIFYDLRERRTAASSLVAGSPQGIAWAPEGDHAWVASPDDESITEIASHAVSRIELPKSASTSPPRMLAVNASTRRAYTTGSLTFPEIALDQDKISRTLELPERSAAIVLSPRGETAYVTFEKLNQIGVLDLRVMKWVRGIELK